MSLLPRNGAARCPLNLFGATLRWTEWGPLDGAPVVCVHGLTRTGRDFDALAQVLAGQGRRVICPDIFGRGLSDWLPDGHLYAVPTYVAALLPVLAALGRPYDWVGTSMGGLIGMMVATVPGNRLRRLVLNDVGPAIPAEALRHIASYLSTGQDFPDLRALEAHLRVIHAPFGPLTDTQWEHLARTSARMTADGRLVLHYDPAIAEPMRQSPPVDVDLWKFWDAVQQPVLVLRGARSELLQPDTVARMLERDGVEAAEVPGCGHAPALMDPGQTALVAEFLGRWLSPQAGLKPEGGR
ncbi:alpha/beta fold hydrolase [Roseomonas elaeocarpi]|uniref:Alpha/beta fold hydrolase n=1 Tax=Roseomonas elaeocarpi TaxID=907779 RepID=A0ABV6JYB3_9PROT